MSLEVSGKIFKLLPEQSGNSSRGDWKKREFILETQEAYPRKICISCWNERVDDLNGLGVGQDIKVSINIESREYNEKWYTDVRAWRIEKGGAGPSTSTPTAETFADEGNAQYEDDLPF